MSELIKTACALADYIEPVAPETACACIFDRLMSEPNLMHIPIVRDGVPQGLVSRQDFLLVYVRMYGREIYGRKPIVVLMDKQPLIVDEGMDCEKLYSLVARQEQSDLLKGFIVVAEDRYLGIGSTAALLEVISVLTHQRAEELERQRYRAEAANKSKSQFLASMSHELRTPLNAIIGFSDLIRQEPFGALEPPRYKEYIDDIHASGVHLLTLIGDILDMAKIESGRVELRETVFHAEQLGKDAIRMMRQALRQADLTLVTDVAESLPCIRADEQQCRQILLNLLSNAIKYTPAGGEIRLSAHVDTNGAMVLTIADTGIGIPPDKIGKVLEPFEQVENTFSRTRPGTGLGLPLAKAMVEAHGGILSLSSTLGKGTQARIVLPSHRVVHECADAIPACPEKNPVMLAQQGSA